VTAFICHVGYEVTKDVVHRLADGIGPDVITTAEAAAGSVPGVVHAHARARWTGRTLRVEVEGWVDPELPAREADALGRQVPTPSLTSSLTPVASLGSPEPLQPRPVPEQHLRSPCSEDITAGGNERGNHRHGNGDRRKDGDRGGVWQGGHTTGDLGHAAAVGVPGQHGGGGVRQEPSC
jgi:hypothetical protein